MSRRLFTLLALAILSAGCLPVTQPLGDINKAEPDKTLVGKWTTTVSRGAPKVLDVNAITVDAPVVKGNPEGLMRATLTQYGRDTEFWFFTATAGKHTYLSLILSGKDNNDPPKFSTEGEFAKWKKQSKKQFFVCRYAPDGDRLTLDCGNNETFGALMRDAKIGSDDSKPIEFYDAPVGWLDKYLDKTGPDKLFDGTNSLKLKREKK